MVYNHRYRPRTKVGNIDLAVCSCYAVSVAFSLFQCYTEIHTVYKTQKVLPLN